MKTDSNEKEAVYEYYTLSIKNKKKENRLKVILQIYWFDLLLIGIILSALIYLK